MYSRKEGHQRSENPGIHWLAVGSRPGNQRPHLLALRQEPYGTIELDDRRRSAALTQQSREQNLLTQAIALGYASQGATF